MNDRRIWSLSLVTCATLVLGVACGNSTTKAPEKPKAVLSDFKLALELKEGTREVSKKFTVTNTGKASLDVDSIKIKDDAQGAFVVRTKPILPASIKPGAALEATVFFRPPLTKAFKATAVVTSNDPTFPETKVELKGAVIARVVCRSDDPCQRAVLDEKTGRCTFTPRGGSCDDKQACTKNDQCLDGVCIGLPTKACYEGDAFACIPGECDNAPIPSILLDSKGQLRRDWKKVLADQ